MLMLVAIDADQPFLTPGYASPSSSLGSHPLTPRMSPLRSQTSPFPLTPSSLDFTDDENSHDMHEPSALSPNPAATIRAALSPKFPKSPLRSTTYSESPTINSDLADTDMSGSTHTRSPSIESRSTYRTSVSSRRYRESTSTYSSRGQSMSMPRGIRNIMDEVPPIPTGPLSSFRPTSQMSAVDSNLSNSPPKGNRANYSGFDFGLTDEPHSYEDNAPSSPYLTRTQTMPTLGDENNSDMNENPLIRWPSQPSPTVPGRPYLPREPDIPGGAIKPAQNRIPSPQESRRCDANPPSNFNAGLGLDKSAYHATEGSTSSSQSSPSDMGSGSSLSSQPSDTDTKPSDMSQIDSMLHELELDQKQSPQAENLATLNNTTTTVLEPPRIVTNFDRGPDSPTDPSLVNGAYSMRNDQRPAVSPKSPAGDRTPAEVYGQQISRPPTAGGTKKRCRGCGQGIVGKSVSSADGRLTGRYHKACFVCFTCRSPFETSDFYVLDDHPYCAQHYHELNGSVCSTCKKGIEGQYLETLEQSTYGTGNPQKFHPDCLTCRTCRVVLRGDYFEWNGQVYCERDARRAAAMTPPPGRRRPTMPSSPLAGPPGFPPGPPPPGFRGPPPRRGPPGSPISPGGSMPRGPPPPGGRGMARPPPPRQGGLAPPTGARRYPERRTTKLMMI
jgi:LIM domain